MGSTTPQIHSNGAKSKLREAVAGKRPPLNDDVVQIYYPSSKKALLREVAERKQVGFQDFIRRVFDDLIEEAKIEEAKLG